MTDAWTERLSDYLDGELDRDTHEALRRHLEGCTECRAALEDYRRLHAWAHDFATGASPRPARAGDGGREDRWAEIARAIGTTRSNGGWRMRRWWVVGAVAAAAALAAVIFVPRRTGTGLPQGDGHPLTSADSALEVQWRELRPQLDTATATTVAEALATINVSLADLTSALDGDPANPLLRTLYQRALADKVTVLVDATARRISTRKG